MNTLVSLNGSSFTPTSVAVRLLRIGDSRRAANGKLYYYHRANKRAWDLQWTSLPETQLSAIQTIGLLTSTFTFIDEAGSSYTVLVPDGGYSATLAASKASRANFFYYDVALTIEES